MTNSRKTVWLIFAIFMFIQLGVAFMVNKNQDNLGFLLNMKGYIPVMLYFSLTGVVLFLFSFMFYQMDTMKANKKISQLENEKNLLKAKLFDMQEEKQKPELVAIMPKEEPKEESPEKPEEDTE